MTRLLKANRTEWYRMLIPCGQSFPRVIVVAAVLSVLSCGKSDDPSDFFPLHEGTRWVYQIQLGEREPVVQQIAHWPIGSGQAQMTLNRRLVGSPSGTPSLAVHFLEMRVKENRVETDGIAEIDVIRDDLGIFRHAQAIQYIVDDTTIREHIIFKPQAIWDPRNDFSGREPGYSDRVILFTAEPNATLTTADRWDSMTFLGLNAHSPSGDTTPTMHFVRMMRPADYGLMPESARLSERVKEETWYQSGRGLVRLEQRVDGVLSMVWELKDFRK